MTSYYISTSYERYGERAALLAIVPGVGHFRSGQYFIGTLTATSVIGLLLWVCWLAILQFGFQHANLSEVRAYFILWTLVVWEASVFHAYYSTMRIRQRDAVRQPVDMEVQIIGRESHGSQFQESGRTKNLSRSGACLVVPKELPIHTMVTIGFNFKSKCRARVIWSKATGKGAETQIGVEFTRPLAAL